MRAAATPEEIRRGRTACTCSCDGLAREDGLPLLLRRLGEGGRLAPTPKTNT
ncbi:MAG: hypothetical protein LBL82_06810 [Oscillospiraceae bacterium]|nr:hypothetical protein [Oscillospiraceae bacterium]